MAKRKAYDWEAIEREFRAGQISIREIANKHGCSDTAIRKKMKVLGVERDLTQKVSEKVRTDLVRNEVRTANPLTEKEIIEGAASVAVEVVRGHRVRLKHGCSVVAKLFKQLDETVDNRDDIQTSIEIETASDKTLNKRNMMLKAVSLQANASIAVSLSTAMRNLIALERQAFNIVDEAKVEENKAIGSNLPGYISEMIGVDNE